MKKIFFATIVALAGSAAVADILMPNAVVIQGEAAQAVFEKIVKVTGQTPTSFRGREAVGANATLSCSRVGDNYACTVAVQK
jgi:hypothetical protein